MFLVRIGATDARFKPITFHDGLNLLVANRTATSRQSDSRNGTGKSSFVRILRYLLAGSLADELKSKELTQHTFTGTFNFGSTTEPEVRIERSVSPTTRVRISGWSSRLNREDLHVDEWRDLVGDAAFSLPPDLTRPTSGQLWGQLVRTHFEKPTKSHSSESDWETGVKLGYLFGLDPSVLNKAGDVSRLAGQRKAIRRAIREGALSHLALNEADLRSELAAVRRRRDQTQTRLAQFQVDEQYAVHQKAADALSAQIRDLNDESLGLERRRREISEALEIDIPAAAQDKLKNKLERAYAEVELHLPETVLRRFDEVADFHASVVRNRRLFLEDELKAAEQRLVEINKERADLDEQRSVIMQLLNDSVALETFLDAQKALTELEASAADISRRLESAISVSNIDTTLKTETAGAFSAVRTELEERIPALEDSLELFDELGSEIYEDRHARLLVSTGETGILKIKPEIDGDASAGIKGVETFLLDIVSLIAAINAGRAPRILVHDSHLFDAVDHRQVASCLNIGARLAEKHGFQYIVTMNSDFLASVESEGAFDRGEYVVDTSLTDATEDGSLFGFRFS